jgi:hypothetical protein
MNPRMMSVSALTLRPLEGLPLAGGATRRARTVAEAELLLRRFAGQIPAGAEPQRFEVAAVFFGGLCKQAEIVLGHEDVHREASPWDGALLGWAKELIEGGDRPRARNLARLAELVRHVAHNRAVGEHVDVYESLGHDVDAAGAARRARVLRGPAPLSLAGSKHSDGRPLSLIARDVRRDIEAAISDGTLPEGLRCVVRIEPFDSGPGLEIEVVRAPRLWIPDLCEMCVPVAFRVQAPPEGGLTCGHTPTLAGYSLAAEGVLLTLLAVGDIYNCDTSRIEDGEYVVRSAFELATCFSSTLGRAQRETLRSSEQAMRERARRRAAAASPASPPLPSGGASCSPAEPSRTAP